MADFGFRKLTLIFAVCSVCSSVFGDDVVVKVDESGNINIINGLVNVTFNATNTDVISLVKNGIDLVGTVTARTFYFDWNAGGGKFSPTNVSVVTNTSDVAHIKFFQPFSKNHLEMEYHVQFHKNLSGFYQWITAKHNGNLTITWSEFRMIYRFSKSVIKSMSNMVRIGEVPNLSQCPTIQDTTWQLHDGYYWSKYDYVGYLRETPWFGMYGGGVGAWVISPSHEYHTGGPLKQDLLTQYGTLMCHYLTSSHFGTGGFTPGYGFSKFYGPWLLYVNSGDVDELFEDVERQSKVEMSQWPYQWVEDSDYPLERGTVAGTVTGQKKAEVVLHSSLDEDHEMQTRGYLFSAKSDDQGNYVIDNVRPGNYVLSVYPLAGHGSDNFVTRNITIIKGNQTIEPVELPEPSNILWAIGETNRRADNFRYSDELRNFYWHTLPPANLTFLVGKSDSARDWYYAQTYNGTWSIKFEDSPDGRNRTLRVAIAAASGSLIFNITTARLQIDINDIVVFNKEYENDKTIYRGALQSGRFYSEKIEIPAETVLDGINKVGLTVIYGSFMYDAISYQKSDDTEVILE